MEAWKYHKLIFERKGLSVKVLQKRDYVCIKKKKVRKYSDLV